MEHRSFRYPYTSTVVKVLAAENHPSLPRHHLGPDIDHLHCLGWAAHVRSDILAKGKSFVEKREARTGHRFFERDRHGLRRPQYLLSRGSFSYRQTRMDNTTA